jgi:NAD(P)H-dependent FMN reductase
MTETGWSLRLAVLVGSTREGRAGAAIARWFVTHANQHAGFEVDVLDLEWIAKPIGFVPYGGVARGLRAVEQLRLVFSELHAVTIRDGVSIGLDDGVDGTGWPCDAFAGRAAKVLLDRLEGGAARCAPPGPSARTPHERGADDRSHVR